MYLNTELPTGSFKLFSCVGFSSYRKVSVVFAFCCSAVGGGKLHQGLAPVSSSPVYTVSPHPGVRSFPLLLGTGNILLSETHLCSIPIHRAAQSVTWQQAQSFQMQNYLSFLMLLSVSPGPRGTYSLIFHTTGGPDLRCLEVTVLQGFGANPADDFLCLSLSGWGDAQSTPNPVYTDTPGAWATGPIRDTI